MGIGFRLTKTVLTSKSVQDRDGESLDLDGGSLDLGMVGHR